MPAPRRVQRERFHYPLDAGRQVEIERVHDPRARRIKLLVGDRGVRLTVPRGVTSGEADAFLLRQHDWLRSQLARIASRAAFEPLQRGAGGSIPLRGGSMPVCWQPARYAGAELGEHGLQIRLPERAPDAAVGRLLRQFYIGEAQRDLGRWLPKYLPGLPRVPSAFRFSPLSSLWGSLSPRGAVSLDLALVLGQPSAFEYVLVHELCHLLQANHSPAFWREVQARWPDWRQDRDWLHGEGMQLKAMLRALLATGTAGP
jgi:predicted metal-dependent hydrolase